MHTWNDRCSNFSLYVKSKKIEYYLFGTATVFTANNNVVSDELVFNRIPRLLRLMLPVRPRQERDRVGRVRRNRRAQVVIVGGSRADLQSEI